MCWQSCKLNLESLRFNIRTFIRSKARLELFLRVDVRPLAALLGWIFLFILVFNAKLMYFLGRCIEDKSFSQGLGGWALSSIGLWNEGPQVFLFTFFYINWKYLEENMKWKSRSFVICDIFLYIALNVYVALHELWISLKTSSTIYMHTHTHTRGRGEEGGRENIKQ